MTTTPRDRQIHYLKTWPEQYEAVLRGDKRHEFRIDDRGFGVGDVLVLREWVPNPKHPKGGISTGRSCTAYVTHINRGPDFGIPEGYAVMTIHRPGHDPRRKTGVQH